MQTQTAYTKSPIAAILRSPKRIPDTEKVKRALSGVDSSSKVTKVLEIDNVLHVRTTVSSMLIMDIATLAEKLHATDVDISLSRSGLIFMFHYD